MPYEWVEGGQVLRPSEPMQITVRMGTLAFENLSLFYGVDQVVGGVMRPLELMAVPSFGAYAGFENLAFPAQNGAARIVSHSVVYANGLITVTATLSKAARLSVWLTSNSTNTIGDVVNSTSSALTHTLVIPM